MADVKITALTAISSNPVNPATFPIPMVDLLDNTITASGTTKKVTVNQILGAGGTATLASATITGAATVGTTLGVTGVSTLTGNVGVGIAPTAGRLHVKGGASQSPLALDTLGYNQIVLQVSGANRGQIYADATNCFAVVNSAGSGTPLVVADTGNVSIANGNLVMTTSGKGIDFSATASGSGTMTSELLNDYEEGTFVPTVGGSTVSGTGTYSVQTGFYTKVGNLVTVEVFLTWTNIVGATGIMILAGLPFQSTSSTNAYSAASIAYVNNISLTASNVLTGMINPGSSFVELQQYPVGGGASTTVTIDTAGSIIYTATYRV